jgi:hypothetical protein
MDRSKEFRKKMDEKRAKEDFLANMLMDKYEEHVKAQFAAQQAVWEAEKAAQEAEESRRNSYGAF